MKTNRLAWLCALAGAGLIGTGLALSQQGLVLAKAIRVCLECVGIG